MRERQIYKIPMHDYNPEEIDKLIKRWQSENINFQIIRENSNFKCPFRIDKQGNFLSCYGINCMAFRKNSEHFWCAKLEPPKGDNNSLHPIQFFNEDDNW